MNEQETVSGHEAAKLLGVSYSHLYKLIERGKLTRLDQPDELREKVPLRFARSQVEELAKRTVKKNNAA